MINLISYIDPGSTALVWQILAGVLIAFGVVLGIWWTKITTFFKSVWARLFGKKKGDNSAGNALDEVSDEISDRVLEEKTNIEIAAQDNTSDEENLNKNDKISA